MSAQDDSFVDDIQNEKLTRFPLSIRQIQVAADTYGTPLYLYDLDTIEEQYKGLRSALPECFTIHYAAKSNSNLSICGRLARLGSSVDVSSLGELHAARKVGFTPDQVVFTGPGKSTEELRTACELGIGLVVVESLNEARRLDRLAGVAGRVQAVLLRINPAYRTQQSCDISQGIRHDIDSKSQIQLICQEASKFGVDEEEASDRLEAIATLPNLQLRGIHIFTESNVLDYQDLLASWQNTIEIANRLRADGHPVEIIDFGGGIGIPYNDVDEPFDVRAFGVAVEGVLRESPFPYQCMVEIGRYLVGESGCYVVEVLDMKKSQGEEFVILDGGIHQLFRISPSMVKASAYLDVLREPGAEQRDARKQVTLAGKLPTALDILAPGVSVPADLSCGDRLAIYNCGAYGFNHSLANFVLHPYAAEAAYDGGELIPIRHRGEVDDFFVRQVWPQEGKVGNTWDKTSERNES